MPLRCQLIAAIILGLSAACSDPSTTSQFTPDKSNTPANKKSPVAPMPCDDLDAFKARLQQTAQGPFKAALEAWTPDQPAAAEHMLPLKNAARRYLKECGGQRAAALTKALVRFPTVSAQQSPVDGPAFVAMASYLKAWATKQKLHFEVFGKNDAWEISLGPKNGKRSVRFIAHADVVPVAGQEITTATYSGPIPTGWTTAPFEVTEQERAGRPVLVGRGTEDNKGPIAAVMTLLETYRHFGLTPAADIVLALGTAEESDWDGMERYAKSSPKAKSNISIDSSFPLVTGQSGFVSWVVKLPKTKTPPSGKGQLTIVSIDAGEFLTQVPGTATMVLMGSDLGRLEKEIQSLVATDLKTRGDGYGLNTQIKDGTLTVTITGKAVHSSTALEGKNALWALSAVASKLKTTPNHWHRFLEILANEFDGDHFGGKLGLNYGHPFMGPLLVVPTMLKETTDGAARLSVNMRRPAGKESKEFEADLEKTLKKLRKKYDAKLKLAKTPYVGEAFLADDGPLPAILLRIYRELSGDPGAVAKAIRGGTYARLFEGAVDFGPSRPGRPYRGHAPDEYIALDTLELLVQAYFEASVRLDQ